jgi:hypothetical protein
VKKKKNLTFSPGGAAVGDVEREHDGEGEVVLPSRRNRNAREKNRPQVSGKYIKFFIDCWLELDFRVPI